MGIGDYPQSPIPNPQSPIPNDIHMIMLLKYKFIPFVLFGKNVFFFQNI